MVGIEYHRALSGISHGEGAIVGSAASGPHALWLGGGRGVIRRGVAGSVPVPECRGGGRRARRRGGVRGPGGAAWADGPGRLPVRLADPNDVEDAFQATFLVLVRRARSVRVADSLGRWLYGVARRVAAKAQARSECARVRSVPLEREPVAPEPPAERIELLAALDEEVSRLPKKYLAPVVLCDLEGLTHAEAAARLRWPVGTVSGRLSRARDLLRNRLVRRGMAPTAGSMVALLATQGARAAVSEPLAAATVQAATRLATGSGSQAGGIGLGVGPFSDERGPARGVRGQAEGCCRGPAGDRGGRGRGRSGDRRRDRCRDPARDRDAGRAPAVASQRGRTFNGRSPSG